MRYTLIPNTNLRLSALCLGTGDFGGGIDREASFAMLDAFRESGGNFLDTAHVYSDWIPGERSRSERLLGDWLKLRRAASGVTVATKGAHPDLNAMHIPRMSPEEIAGDVEDSLRKLQLDCISLYYLHRDDPSRPVEEIIDSLQSQVQAGKIRYFACSNWTAPRLKAAQEYATSQGNTGFVAVQNLWNLADTRQSGLGDPTIRVMDNDLWQYHQQTHLAAIPFSSQANGLFQKLDAGQRDNLSAPLRATYLNPVTEARFERLKFLREQTGLTTTQVVLGYLAGQPFPTIPVIGPRSMAQLQDSLTAADIALSPQQIALLNQED